ncbi:transcriptional regulator BetI [Aestuariivirga sp.]|uniref:transcriptional regulator BetI n=1 Tax=Aestuariivirga sp. TaxID=2650926 RepID=UPI00391B6E86
MPKLGMAPIRRRQLVEAAIAVIHEQGFANATVARIARRAGMSPGLVHHYFTDKDDLLFTTMRSLLAELRAEAAVRLGNAEGPRERIVALIDACFGESQFEEQVFSAWLALYGNARHSARLMTILTLYHKRLRSSLLHDLKRLVPRDEALRLAEGIGAMIDGLWLRYALTGKPDLPETPRALTRDYLSASLERALKGSRAGLNMHS